MEKTLAIRKTTPILGLFLISITLLLGALHSADAQLETAPKIRFGNRLMQGTLGRAYDGALDNLLRINTVADTKDKHNKAGLMSQSKLFIRAGGGYEEPWTRDASINTWNAGSLLEPVVARNTLWAVCQKQPDGGVVLQRDNQWWDKVIWVTAAWNHFKVTGDRVFLQTAYGVAQDELALMQKEHFNAKYGLFAGPAFFADGIAAYPAPIYDAKNGSSFVLDHPFSKDIMALSTNCVYFGALRSAALMARQLQRPASEIAAYEVAGDALKTAINRHLWNPAKSTYGYFIYGSGPLIGQRDETQEGIGLAYAILFGVTDSKQTQSLLRTTRRTPFGIPTQFPHFSRFSDEKPGRHNQIVWPLVNGMWATAAAKSGDTAAFADETENLALLSLDGGNRFYEIYNSQSGKPDGGWQGGKWGPINDQTWSATAYLQMIYQGLFGMNFQTEGLEFSPKLPAGWGDVSLQNLKYRGLTLDVDLQGQGTRIARVVIDGKVSSRTFIPANLVGKHTLSITLKH